MDWVAAAAMASVLGTSIVAVGLTMSWRRNGRDQRRRDESMAMKQALRDKEVEMGYRAVVDRLDHKDTGLGALEKKITGFDVAIGRHDERITGLERDKG